MEELKSCPFCGGRARIFNKLESKIIAKRECLFYTAKIKCIKCGANTIGESIEEATEIWNKRIDKNI